MKRILCAALMLLSVLVIACTAENGYDFISVSGLNGMFERIDDGEYVTSFAYCDNAYEGPNRAFVTCDEDEIRLVLEALRNVRIDCKTDLFVTDLYPLMTFELSGGTSWTLRFDYNMLETDEGMYLLENDEALWNAIGTIAEMHDAS
ncbi:MAG: hypothetical protein IKR85_01050 [Clostridia bacterium]|nr:hypothetical protein [Clostridia bacterium]